MISVACAKMVDNSCVIEGTVKFRDGKKVRKLLFNYFYTYSTPLIICYNPRNTYPKMHWNAERLKYVDMGKNVCLSSFLLILSFHSFTYRKKVIAGSPWWPICLSYYYWTLVVITFCTWKENGGVFRDNLSWPYMII